MMNNKHVEEQIAYLNSYLWVCEPVDGSLKNNMIGRAADTMQALLDVARAAKALRDDCMNHSGTPPAPLIFNLDDALAKLEATR